MNKISKAVYVVNIDNYYPEIVELTLPLIKNYAQKIGATLIQITSRKFPEYPIPYEKLQIREYAKTFGFDWNIYIDIDAIVHPDLFDVTVLLPKDTILHNGIDMASNRWTYDEYFLRDGRNIGSCNWFTVASDWCLDLWKPLDDLTLDEALANIHPIQGEVNVHITPDHLLDDYTLSRNIAKYGLKTTTMSDLLTKVGQFGNNYFWHEYQMPKPERVKNMCAIIKNWGCLGYYPEELAKKIDTIGTAEIERQQSLLKK